MKRFFKFGNSASGGSMKKNETRKVDQSPTRLSRMSSLSGSTSSGWGSITNFSTSSIRNYRIDSFKIKGFTKLHKASWLGNLDKVKKHLKNIEISQKDCDSRTPLHLACAQGHRDVVLYLLRCKADLASKDSDGNTPLLIAIICRQHDVCSLLLDEKAHPNDCNLDGDTGLHLASKCEMQDVVFALVGKRADINARNNNFCTPLYVATCLRLLEMVKLLLRLGADVNIANQQKKTCLMVACEEGFDELVQVFLEHQVDTTAVNDEGLTAEEIAQIAENDRCTELILNYKTEKSLTNVDTGVGTLNDTSNSQKPEIRETHESNSDSWNDDFSEEIPQEKMQNVLSRLDLSMFHTDVLPSAANTKSIETEQTTILVKPDMKQLSDLKYEAEKLEFHHPTSKSVDQDLLAELGLSDLSDASNSLKLSKCEDIDDEVAKDAFTFEPETLSSAVKEQRTLTKLTKDQMLDMDFIPSDNELEYIDSDDENVSTNEKKPTIETDGDKIREEGTLGRLDTMQMVDEIWENNPVIVDNSVESPGEDGNGLYYAELAVVNSKGSTIERDTVNETGSLDDKMIPNEDSNFADHDNLWEELLQRLFGIQNDEVDESTCSVSGLAEDDMRENSLKDVTFQEISSNDDQSNISIQEDRPYSILTRFLKDSVNSEKVLSLFQRLRVVLLKEQTRCRSLRHTVSLLNNKNSQTRLKFETLTSDRLEVENQLNRVESESELLRQQLSETETKRIELELHLKQSEEHILKLEADYLAEVNLRQEAQVALRASQEELRVTDEVFDEFRTKRSTEPSEMTDKSTQISQQEESKNDTEIVKLIEENKDLQNRLKLEKQHSTIIEEDKVHLKQELEELHAVKGRQDEVVNQLKRELKSVDNCDKVTSLQDELNDLQKSYNVCKSDLERATKLNAVYEDSQIVSQSKWEEMLTSFKNKSESAAKETIEIREKAMQEKSKLMGELNETMIQKSELELELGRMRREKVFTSEMLSTAEASLQEKEQEMFASENSLKSLQRDHQFLSRRISQLMDREKDQQQQLNSATAELLRAQVLNDELDQLKIQVKMDETRTKEIGEHNKKLREEIQSLRNGNLDLSKVNEELLRDLENVKSQQNDALIKSNTNAQENSKLKNELNFAREKIEELDQNLVSKLAENEVLKESMQSLKMSSERLQTKIFETEMLPTRGTIRFEDQAQQKVETAKQECNPGDRNINNLCELLESFIKEVKADHEKSKNIGNSPQSSAQLLNSDYLHRSELELIKNQFETQYYLELNKKLEQINRFLEGQSFAAEHLEKIHSRSRNQMQSEYQTAIQSFQTEIKRLRVYTEEKDRRHIELEERYQHLKELIKAKRRIKRKVVQQSVWPPPTFLDYTALFKSSQHAMINKYQDTNPTCSSYLGLDL